MSRTHSDRILRHLQRTSGLAAGSGLPDGELLRRWVRSRDEAAFEVLAWRHGPMVLAVCRRLLAAADVDDAFQATFLTLVRKGHTVADGEAVGGWLYRVAHRVALAARSAAALTSTSLTTVDVPATSAGPPERAEQRDTAAAVLEELARLPRPYRDVIVLCHLEGLTQTDAGRELGCPKGTVSTRLTRARAILRTRLARRGYGPAALVALRVAAERPPVALVRSAVARSAPARVVALAAAVSHGATFGPRAALAALLVCLAAGAATRVGMPTPPPAPAAATPGPPSKVDALGDPLPPGAVRRFGTARFHHGQFIDGIACFPDGKLLASVGSSGRVSLWELPSGREVARLVHPHGDRLVLALSPDGRTLATGRRIASPDAGWRAGAGGPDAPDVLLWDVATRTVTRRIVCADEMNGLAFSPDGRHLAGGSSLRVWDAATGKEVWSADNAKQTLLALAYSPDGAAIACSVFLKPGEYQLRIVDAATGRERQRLDPTATPALPIVYSPDGKLLATGGSGGTVTLRDAAMAEARRTLKGFQSTFALAFSPDGRTLAASDGGREPVRLWDVAAGTERVRIDRPGQLNQGGMLLTFAPDGKTLVAADLDGALYLYDPATGKRQRPAAGPDLMNRLVRVSADGQTLFAFGWDRSLSTWDLATGKLLRTVRSDALLSGSVSPTGSTLAVPTQGEIVLQDTRTAREIRRFPGGDGNPVYFSPDGRFLAAGVSKYIVVVLDAATGREVQRLTGLTGYLRGAAFSPDGKSLATVSYSPDVPGDRAACLWELATGKPRHWLWVDDGTPRASADDVAFLPDGHTLVTLCDHTVELWDADTGARVRTIVLPDGNRLAVSPDGRAIATGSDDRGPIRLWEAATGKERHRLAGHRAWTMSLAFTPDGRQLVSGQSDSTVLAWDLDPTAGEAAGQPADADRLWSDLASDDAAVAYRAIWRLAKMSRDGVHILADRLTPLPKKRIEQLRQLLLRLDDADFAAREKASRELEALGIEAEPALRHALAGQPSAEVRRRVTQTLKALAEHPAPASGKQVRPIRALEALERIGSAEARRAIAAFVDGPAEDPLREPARAIRRRLSLKDGR